MALFCTCVFYTTVECFVCLKSQNKPFERMSGNLNNKSQFKAGSFFVFQKIWYNFIGECEMKRAKEVSPQCKGSPL